MSEIYNKISRLSGRPTVYVNGPKKDRPTYCRHLSCPIAAVSGTKFSQEIHNKISRLSGRPTLHVDGPKWFVQPTVTQQNIMTEWMPHSVCQWAKRDLST